MKTFLLLMTFFLLSAPVFAQNPTGKWEGSIFIMEMDLGIVANFNEKDGKLAGTIDIPQQSAYSLPLQNIKVDGDKIDFELMAGPGNIAKFKGLIQGDSIAGDFEQAGFKGTFQLYKAVAETIDESSLSYTNEEVTFYNNDIKFAGTLSIPKGTGQFPAVVLITGSGSQNRDSEVFGFKIFKVLADHLASNGIAVLRYDDRGIGGSDRGPEDITSHDLSYDVEAAVNLLAKHGKINKSKIGLIGHSEGGLIAPIVANRMDNLSFIVTMAGPGVPGEDISMHQFKVMHENLGTSEEDFQQSLKVQQSYYSAVRTGAGWDNVRSEFIKIEEAKVTDEIKAAVPDWRNRIEQSVDQQIKSGQSGWVQYFMIHDPASEWQKIDIPALVIFGGKDFQVPYLMNKTAVEKALDKGGNTEYQIKLFDEANHLFQTAVTGYIDEYSLLEKRFVEGFPEYISDWIKQVNK